MRYNKSNRGNKSNLKSREKRNKNKTKYRTKTSKHRTKTSKHIMKGGFSPFSVWDTMTYNLSNALSTFSISPPTAVGNVSEPVNPSISKQFLQVE
jgi:hypothetical protein